MKVEQLESAGAQENRAGERGGLQRGVDRQPGQAAGRVQVHLGRLGEQVRRHLKVGFYALLNIILIIVINITQHPLPRTNLREIFRKLATLEADATRGNERAEVHIWQIKTLLMITMEILEVKTAEHKPYV